MAKVHVEGNSHARNIRAFIQDEERSTNSRLGIQLNLLQGSSILIRRLVTCSTNADYAASDTASIHLQDLARHPAGIRAGEEQHRIGDVLHRSKPAHR